jgi:hypothetical protein
MSDRSITSIIDLVALSALNYAQGNPLSAARMMASAAESPHLIAAVKHILRSSTEESMEAAEHKKAETRSDPNSGVEEQAQMAPEKEQYSVLHEPTPEDIAEELADVKAEGADPDDAAKKDSKEDSSEALAEKDSDDMEEESEETKPVPKAINARFAKALMNLQAMAIQSKNSTK